jgi:hypothetical protein
MSKGNMNPSSDQERVLTEARIEIAQLKTTLGHLVKGMEDLNAANRQQNAEIREIMNILNQASGGWKTMMIIGGSASAVGGAIAWVLAHMKFGG